MNKFSAILAVAMCLTASVGFSASGTVETSASPVLPNALNITIEGEAAKEISKQLSQSGVEMQRDGFSGALVQASSTIRCIDQDHSLPLYCSITLIGSDVK